MLRSGRAGKESLQVELGALLVQQPDGGAQGVVERQRARRRQQVGGRVQGRAVGRDEGEARDDAGDLRRVAHQPRARQAEAAVLRAQRRLSVDAQGQLRLGELEPARRRLGRVSEQRAERRAHQLLVDVSGRALAAEHLVADRAQQEDDAHAEAEAEYQVRRLHVRHETQPHVRR